MAKWTLKDLQEIPSTFTIALHPLATKILLSRGFENESAIESFINPDYEKDSIDPFAFEDMDKVVARIELALKEKQIVAIFGDYDADGVTSSAILKTTLDDLGVENFVYIPDKKSEGYSMSLAAMGLFKEKKVSLIITVDCGITSIAEVEKAATLGMDVIITDHHHVPAELPNAYAIINPHFEGSKYPFKDLAGVGVAFKVSQAIYQKLMPEKRHFSKWMLLRSELRKVSKRDLDIKNNEM